MSAAPAAAAEDGPDLEQRVDILEEGLRKLAQRGGCGGCGSTSPSLLDELLSALDIMSYGILLGLGLGLAYACLTDYGLV